MDAGEVRVERAVERGRVDAVDAVQLLAPLHGAAADVPQPPPGVGERLGVAEAGLGLGQRGLRQALLGDVAGDADDPAARPVGVADRTQRQRDRDRHAVLALDLGLDVVDALAAEHRVEEPTRRRGRGREQIGQRAVPTTSSAWRPKIRSALRFHSDDAPSMRRG